MTIKEFEELFHKKKLIKYNTVPEKYVPVTKFKINKANGLTRAILEYIRYTNNYADRINNTGIYDTRTKKFRKSNTRKGIADIIASKKITINDRTIAVNVAIEIKIGKDQLSEYQKNMRDEITQKGGYYILAKDWDTFISQWENIK